MLQISLIDTWAATQAGAFALSENSLYTTNAWNTFLDRLKPGGILSRVPLVLDPRQRAARDVPHGVSRRTDADQPRGQEPRDHILIFKGPVVTASANVATILVSPTPFSAEGPGHAHRHGEAAQVRPGPHTDDPPIDKRFADLTQPGGPGPALHEFNADVSAPTDDRPFFFQMVNFKQVLKGEGIHSQNNIYKAVWVLTILAVTVIALAALCIASATDRVAPPRRPSGGTSTTRHAARSTSSSPRSVSGSCSWRSPNSSGSACSSVIPTYALTVVLFTVLVFSGIGSLLTDRFVRLDRRATVIGPFVGLLIVLAVFGLRRHPRHARHGQRNHAGAGSPWRSRCWPRSRCSWGCRSRSA